MSEERRCAECIPAFFAPPVSKKKALVTLARFYTAFFIFHAFILHMFFEKGIDKRIGLCYHISKPFGKKYR